MGRVEWVRVRASVPPGCGHVTFEELMVVARQSLYVHLVTAGGKHVAHIGGEIHHALVAKGLHGRPIPVKGPFYFSVQGKFVIIS